MRVLSMVSAKLVVLALACVAMLATCSGDDAMTLTLDFRQSDQGWVGDFADYPVGEDAFYQLVADYRALPEPLTASGSGLFTSGNNHSDDLWMFYKGRIGGLSPDTDYQVRFDMEIATSVPNGCVGVGGSPGEDVTVKAGVSEVDPTRVDIGGFWRMDVDKGEQTNGGANAVVMGDMANSVPCGEDPRWELKQLSSGSTAIQVTTDRAGTVWLFVGTDSGFEATTSVYFTRLTPTFQPSPAPATNFFASPFQKKSRPDELPKVTLTLLLLGYGVQTQWH